MKDHSPFEERARLVRYIDGNSKPCLKRWPETYPLPPSGDYIIVESSPEIFAIKEDVFFKERAPQHQHDIFRLYKSEFSETYVWSTSEEDPSNPVLYPHLAKSNPYLEDLEGPNDDYFADGGPSLEDLN